MNPEKICGRYGYDGCPNPIEPGWVFCHEHRLSHVGPTQEEELAEAERRGHERGLEDAAWAVDTMGNEEDLVNRDDAADLIRQLKQPGKERKK